MVRVGSGLGSGGGVVSARNKRHGEIEKISKAKKKEKKNTSTSLKTSAGSLGV